MEESSAGPGLPATWTEVVLVLRDGTEVAVGRVPVASRVDLGTVEGLARMQLGARARGARLFLRHPQGRACRLAELLDLVGLTGQMTDTMAEASRLLGGDSAVSPR
ncbi:hypothetical protein BH24ACT4_BH24ACT4_23820 [soil metagenome]